MNIFLLPKKAASFSEQSNTEYVYTYFEKCKIIEFKGGKNI